MDRLTLRRAMRSGFAAAALALCLAAAASDAPPPKALLSTPAALSVQAVNPVALSIESPVAQAVRARFDLRSLDGLVTVPVFDAELDLPRGRAETGFLISPAQLAPFALDEKVMLAGTVGSYRTETVLPVSASVPPPEASGWILNVPTTAVVYSANDSLIGFRIVNPKGKPLAAKLHLKFKNLKGKTVAKWVYPVIALPGESGQAVTVPVSVCLKAKLKGANSLKTVLMVSGEKKASGQSLLDWDLLVSASADKTAGPAPLSVAFTTLVSGGSAPYAYDWNFGDGSAHASAQNPSHTFAAAGVYTVDLLVTDNRGGVVAASPIVIAAQ